MLTWRTFLTTHLAQSASIDTTTRRAICSAIGTVSTDRTLATR